jgi:capsid protein
MTKRDVQEAVEWIPNGAPWLDKLKQVKGDELAISLHLDNPIDAARRRGEDVFENVDKSLAVEKYERDQRAIIFPEDAQETTDNETESD